MSWTRPQPSNAEDVVSNIAPVYSNAQLSAPAAPRCRPIGTHGATLFSVHAGNDRGRRRHGARTRRLANFVPVLRGNDGDLDRPDRNHHGEPCARLLVGRASGRPATRLPFAGRNSRRRRVLDRGHRARKGNRPLIDCRWHLGHSPPVCRPCCCSGSRASCSRRSAPM